MRMPIFFRRILNRVSYKAKKFNFFRRLAIFLLLIIAVYSLFLYNDYFKPILSQLSAARASAVGQLVINNSIRDIMKSDIIVQNMLVDIEKDESGQVAAVTPNFAMINQLKSEITMKIQENLQNENNSRIYIPIGNLTGIDLLSNLGPKLRINLIPVGVASVDFVSAFSEAGINQTRLQILVNVNLEMSLILPNNTTAGTTVKTTIPMSETIIVGKVPNYYTNLETSREEMKQNLLDLASFNFE